MTLKQIYALKVLKRRWDYVSPPSHCIGSDPCVMVSVKSLNTGVQMSIGIETDGHCHT